jgi:hypothetical protein
LTAAAVDGVVGGTHDTLKILGTAMWALHLHGILAAHRKKFKKLIALQAFKFVNRHRYFLD